MTLKKYVNENACRRAGLSAGLCLGLFLALAPLQALAGTATVFVEGVPGGVIVNTVEINAKVIEIDHVKRVATLEDEKGETFTAKAGPKAVNFDQVNVGDTVRVALTEELVVFVDEDGVEPSSSMSAAAKTAEKGEKPGGIMAQTRQVTGTVTEIDQQNRKVTLDFGDGRKRAFPVREDIDLAKQKVGDKVVFSYTETIAVSVEKP